MSIRKKFKTNKYLYRWGVIYDPETGDEMNFKAEGVFCRTSWAWIQTYQKSKEDTPKVIRIVFVD